MSDFKGIEGRHSTFSIQGRHHNLLQTELFNYSELIRVLLRAAFVQGWDLQLYKVFKETKAQFALDAILRLIEEMEHITFNADILKMPNIGLDDICWPLLDITNRGFCFYRWSDLHAGELVCCVMENLRYYDFNQSKCII